MDDVRIELKTWVNTKSIFDAFIKAHQDWCKTNNQLDNYLNDLVNSLPIKILNPKIKSNPFRLEFLYKDSKLAIYLKFTKWDRLNQVYNEAQLFGKVLNR